MITQEATVPLMPDDPRILAAIDHIERDLGYLKGSIEAVPTALSDLMLHDITRIQGELAAMYAIVRGPEALGEARVA